MSPTACCPSSRLRSFLRCASTGSGERAEVAGEGRPRSFPTMHQGRPPESRKPRMSGKLSPGKEIPREETWLPGELNRCRLTTHSKSSPVSAGHWEEQDPGRVAIGVGCEERVQPLPFFLSLASHPATGLPARFETVTCGEVSHRTCPFAQKPPTRVLLVKTWF